MHVGPAKPKLVAKTGHDNSPWKVQKNAPSIPATDVPGSLRPIMSCTLWRIHESIHRNDENQVFMLTDQPNIQDVAQKLNIIVRSIRQTSDLLARREPPTNLEVFGELEQEFGVHAVKERRPIKNTSTRATMLPATNGTTHSDGSHQGEDKAQGNVSFKGTDTEGRSSTPKPKILDDKPVRSAPISESSVPNTALSIESQFVDGCGEVSTLDLTTKNIENSLPGLREESLGTTSTAQDLEALLRAPFVEPEAHDVTTEAGHNKIQKLDGKEDDTIDIVKSASQSTANNVWSRSWADALIGNQSIKTPPKQAISGPPANKQSATRAKSPLPPSEDLPPLIATPAKAAEEPEDSDEEVVVFQPKRLSTQQKKSTQHNSRPTTPNTQAQPASETQSPRQSAGRGQHTPKTSHHLQKIVNGVGLAPSKPSNINPPVIDPDAFGRDFAVNTNSTPRGSMRGIRVRHSPQASLHNSGLTTSRPSSSHRQPRGSPNRPSPKTSPQQPLRTPALLEGITGGAQAVQLPIGTGRPSPTPAPEIRSQMLNANAPIFQPAVHIPNPLPPSPSQPKSVPAPIAPPKLAPIGSGRPSSKTSQQSSALTQPKPASDILQQDSAFMRSPTQRATPEAQQQDAEFVREAPIQPRYPSPQQQALRPTNRSHNPNQSYGTQKDAPSSRLGSSFVPRGRGGAGPRPVKPSLFDPELDHTRAYQSDTEPRKSAVTQEVQYVLKSGSTREQARGKGKLWVG